MKHKCLAFLFLCMGWIPLLAQDSVVVEKRVLLELGMSSFPSREAWLGLAFGAGFGKNEFRIHVQFKELRPAYSNWSKPLNLDNSVGYAFALDHRYPFWETKYWAFLTHSLAQIQKIDVYDGGRIVGYPRTYLRSYPRFQLSTGIGLQFSFARRCYFFHSIRYGFAIGNFYHVQPITRHFLSAISTGICFGIRL